MARHNNQHTMGMNGWETVLMVTSNDDRLQEEAMTTGGEHDKDNHERQAPADQPLPLAAPAC
jgi:hypothetical protein